VTITNNADRFGVETTTATNSASTGIAKENKNEKKSEKWSQDEKRIR
jgi:hypothetical protein